MNALASQRGGSLTMRLDPPGLGQVVIRMTVSDGVVQAELHASNSAGRVVMERGLETLRASLESRGLTVERLSVQASSTSSESQGTRSESNAQDEGQQQSDKDEKEDGRQDAAGRESRGRHEERGVRSDQDDSNQNQQDVSFTQIMSEDAA
jgi:flagellar hook-length control protein FliK